MSRLRTLLGLALGAAHVVAAGAPAHADATLGSVSGGAGLSESDHRLSLQLSGSIATAVSEQTIVNSSKSTREALYTFELPGDAAVTDVTIRLADGRVATATVVDADAAIAIGSDDKIVDADPDIGLLRLVERAEADPLAGGTDVATYELRVYPVEAGRAVVVKTEWVAPLRYDDGRMSLRIPGRGSAGALVREDVSLRIEAPSGARAIGPVYGGGRELARRERKTRGRYAVTAPADADLVVEYAPEFAQRPPRALVSFAATRVDNTRGALAVSVLVPPPAPSEMPEYERVIVVADVSRSMQRDGVDAAAAMVGAILDAAGHRARVEVIFYDRTSRPLFGELRANDRKARAEIERAFADIPLDNGSALGLALDDVRNTLAGIADLAAESDRAGVARGIGPTTLIAIVTDGMTPLDLTEERAADRIGDLALDIAEVLSVTVVPDAAPAPDTTAGPLGSLARRTGGRSIAVKVGGATDRAAALTAELTRPPSIELAELHAGAKTTLDGLDLPNELQPGRGVFAVGGYAGKLPTALMMTGTVKGESISVKAKRGDKQLRGAALALWLVRATIDDLVMEGARVVDPDAEGAGRYDDKSLADAARALVAVAGRAPAVTRYSSLAAAVASNKFTKERLAFASKWGPKLFFRVPPPPETAADHEFRELRIIEPGTGNDNPAWRPTGDLDFDIVARLMRTFVLPRAQICYLRELRNRRKLAGTLTVIVEIARGEVQEARIVDSNLPGDDMEKCVLDAAYAIQVPRVALGDDVEYIGVARYPIKFQRVGSNGKVVRGKDRNREQPADADDPLGGLPVENSSK
jgi:hypothetical protein